MSAYFVNKATIDAVVTFLAKFTNPIDCANKTELGREMWLLNASAMCQRYRSDKLEDYTGAIAAYTFTADTNNEVTQIKALNCLLYQCSEGDVGTLALYKMLRAVSDELDFIKAMPEYDAAPWGLDA